MNLFIARKICGECVLNQYVAVEVLADNPKLEEITGNTRFMSKIKFASHSHPTKTEYEIRTNLGGNWYNKL